MYYYLALSGIEPRKNWLRLINAHKKFLDRNTDSHLGLILCGFIVNHLYFEKLKKHIALNNIKNIQWVISPTEIEKNNLLKDAKFIVYPSLYEGFGFPILEAFKHTKAVITSSISSMPEIAKSSAVYVNPFDEDELSVAIEILIKDKVFCRRISDRTHEMTTKFSWEEIGNAQSSLIDKILE